MPHIPALDGVRGTAALLVLLAHFDGLLGVRNGTLGVDVFFVLSGFLITSLLANEIATTGSISFGKFYMRRLLRLTPALILAVLLFSAIDLALGFNTWQRIAKAASLSLLYVSNFARAYGGWSLMQFGHTWSLAIEEQFYLIWPVLLLAFASIGRNFRAALVLTVILAVSMFLLRYSVDTSDRAAREWVSNSFQTRAVAIFVGAVAALIPLTNWIGTDRLTTLLRFAAPAGLASVIAALIVNQDHVNADYMAWQQPFVLVGTACVLLHLRFATEGWMVRMFTPAWLIYTGKISYGLYLFHYPLWYLTLARIPTADMPNEIRQLIGLFVLTPVAYGMAWASYRYVESPVLRLKSRFRPPLAAEAAAA